MLDGEIMTAARASRRTARTSKNVIVADGSLKAVFIRYLPAWVMLSIAMLILLPHILAFSLNLGGQVLGGIPRFFSNLFYGPSNIAPLFTPEVRHWAGDIGRWAHDNELDPNLLATVMQIESCGHPDVSSYAGAQGLFQVMPFHFDAGENQLDPNTNAKRGASFLKVCTGYANGDSGLAMACYNGGPSVTMKPYAQWPDQTQRYYMWGTGIYADAQNNSSHSETLDRWLAAGGSGLCQMAASTLGM